MKVSGIVVTKNEETNICECLESLKWADEIIIVDSNSNDKTIKIAKKYSNKIYSVEIDNVAEKRKFAIDKSSFDWILFLDADERITPELNSEIINLSVSEASPFGYYINRKNFYLGKWIKHCGLYPDYQLRLFRKDKAKVTDRIVHEGIEIDGPTENLKNHILHYSCRDLYQMVHKVNYYSTLEAKEHLQNKKHITKVGVFTHSISAFFRIFISRKGYKDKLQGFFVSFSDSITNLLTHLKLLKLQNRI
jgi:glycosyltransferase involved in cell wall biosynthesis